MNISEISNRQNNVNYHHKGDDNKKNKNKGLINQSNYFTQAGI